MKNRIVVAARLLTHWSTGIIVGALMSKNGEWQFVIIFGAIIHLIGQLIVGLLQEPYRK